MKWISEDIDMYLKSREYVDTIVLPLLPISLGEDMKSSVSMTEFISLLTNQLERQFRGRLIMLPGFSYLKNDSSEKNFLDLKIWEKEFKEKGFQHVFYVTSDSYWRTKETELEGSLIWLPSLPLENMDQNYKVSILEDQVKQLLNIFVQKWNQQ
ncbi:YpiF family protein [Cytobacillus spongiae]|uniref:YpiF family protein n=1 Tax=Cytobacillus spongiae TaxID=2901381 RepID=UPI001F2DB35E|nr:YpiF family protein [Cytobacillus spongiae]UII54627.1 YpiF family protein [Cytobacillus spongiae]